MNRTFVATRRAAAAISCTLLIACAVRHDSTTSASVAWPATTAPAALERARELDRRGDFDAALETLGDAIAGARAASDDRALAVLLAESARVHANAVFTRNRGASAARAVAAEAVRLAVEIGDRAAEATALEAAGMIDYADQLWHEANDYSRPRASFARALGLREALGQPGAETTFYLGLTFEQEGKLEEARRHYERALALAERARDLSTVAYALRHLAGRAEERGELADALAMHRRCLALREQLGLIRLVPYALVAIGDLERKLGDAAAARASYQRAREIGERARAEPALVTAYLGLGSLAEQDGDADAALSHYDHALQLATRLAYGEAMGTARAGITRARQSAR